MTSRFYFPRVRLQAHEPVTPAKLVGARIATHNSVAKSAEDCLKYCEPGEPIFELKGIARRRLKTKKVQKDFVVGETYVFSNGTRRKFYGYHDNDALWYTAMQLSSSNLYRTNRDGSAIQAGDTSAIPLFDEMPDGNEMYLEEIE